MSTLEKKAARFHTHIIVFKRGSEETRCAIKAMIGKSTKRIAREMGISESMAEYRILKAQRAMGVRFRQMYRNGGGNGNSGRDLADYAEAAMEKRTSRIIQRNVTPRFLPLASSRLNQ